MSNFSLIREAIRERKIVTARYDGYTRQMCPHTLGYKDGREKALLYQFGGGSKSGLRPPGSPANWRCVFVDELSGVEVSDGDWHTAQYGHSQHQSCIEDVVAEVRG